MQGGREDGAGGQEDGSQGVEPEAEEAHKRCGRLPPVPPMSCAKLRLRLLAPWAACMLGRFAAAIHIADHGDGTYAPAQKVAVRLPVILQSSEARTSHQVLQPFDAQRALERPQRAAPR